MVSSQLKNATCASIVDPAVLKAANVSNHQEPKIIDIRQGDIKLDLRSAIVDGLTCKKAENDGLRSLPTLLLYDQKGLQLFEQITYLEEYYLTNEEISILEARSEDIVQSLTSLTNTFGMKTGVISVRDSVFQRGLQPEEAASARESIGKEDQDHVVLIELGSGTLRKTRIILDAFDKAKVPTKYYALDVSRPELVRSLAALEGRYEHVQSFGLLGTYEDGFKYMQDLPKSIRKCVLWLGSSVGNYTRDEASCFLRQLGEECMNEGDLLLLGVDRRNESSLVEKAYNDSQGVTRDFIRNSLFHANRLLGKTELDPSKLEYHCLYNKELGRHESYLIVEEAFKVDLGDNHIIQLEKDELILIEHSYKYSDQELEQLLDASRIRKVTNLRSSKGLYTLNLCQKPPFFFKAYSNPGRDSKQVSPGGQIPTLEDWEELWKAWDTITLCWITPAALHARPIDLRHDVIFYIGHLPAFANLQLHRQSGVDLVQPQGFTDLFERGLDPDVMTGTCTHWHSHAPAEWPAIEDILAFRDDVREMVRRMYDTKTGTLSDSFSIITGTRKRLARALWMSFEHEAMHLETLLYMLVQIPDGTPLRLQDPGTVARPLFHCTGGDNQETADAEWISVGSQTVDLGFNDDEDQDFEDANLIEENGFGWDNEKPLRQVRIDSGFEISSRPVSVSEYLKFLSEVGPKESLLPKSWGEDRRSSSDPVDPANFVYKTMFGDVSLKYCFNWPVFVNGEQAQAYCDWKKDVRLPTEAELVAFFKLFKDERRNYGFRSWTPVDMETHDRQGWEWTSSEFNAYEGFKDSALYPGYSSDFFEGKHSVVLGYSFATHPALAERPTFRNWYQRKYPYVFASFRCVKKNS